MAEDLKTGIQYVYDYFSADETLDESDKYSKMSGITTAQLCEIEGVELTEENSDDIADLKESVQNAGKLCLYILDQITDIESTQETKYAAILNSALSKEYNPREINAVFTQAGNTEDSCYVVFKDLNGKILKSGFYEIGSAVTPPKEDQLEIPNGKIFCGWDSDAYQDVQTDIFITAILRISIKYGEHRISCCSPDIL